MERVCWEHFKHKYGPQGQLKAWADYQRAYQQWRRSCLTDAASQRPSQSRLCDSDLVLDRDFNYPKTNTIPRPNSND